MIGDGLRKTKKGIGGGREDRGGGKEDGEGE